MKKLLFLVSIISFLGCFPYIYYKQNEVLIKDIDIDQTLEVAVNELKEGGFDAVLTIWAIRDQIFTPEQAKKVNDIYLEYIDKVKYKNETTREFGIWHFAWAISNIYRNGNDEVREVIKEAYSDAIKRPASLKKFNKISDELINGEKIYMGDVHGLGRAYAKTHIVAPGNKEYVQSYKDYLEEKNKNNKKII